jgi:hypothetical protein
VQGENDGDPRLPSFDHTVVGPEILTMPRRIDDLSDPLAYLTQYRSWAGCGNAISDGSGLVTFPETHSFVDDPEGALGAIEQLITIALDSSEPVCLDRSRSARVDGCAATVTAAIAGQVVDAGRELTRKLPVDPQARDSCECFQIPAKTSSRSTGVLTRVFGTAKERSTALMTTRGFIDTQLQSDLYSLDTQLMNDFGSLFMGEALDNGLMHGAGDCWLSSIVHKGSPGGLARVELVIFNLGSSMDENILEIPDSNPIRGQLEALIAEHQSAGHFTNGWTPKALLVRHALQHRITSSVNGRGGIGSHGMISFYEQLTHGSTATDAACVIVSGSTYVRLSPRYQLRASLSPNRRAPIQDIAFNDDNDFRLPADNRCIRSLSRRLPGTMVVLQFTVRPDHLIKREIPR